MYPISNDNSLKKNKDESNDYFLVFVLQSVAQMLFAQNLTIEVRDIEKVEGHLYVALYNSEEAFMKKPLTAFRIDVKIRRSPSLARDFLRHVCHFPFPG